MWHLFVGLAVLGLPQVTALRVGRQFSSEHSARKRAAVQSKTVGFPECEGHAPQWIQEGQVKRLKGPVVHIHMQGPYHVAGNYLAGLAHLAGNMTSFAHAMWDGCFEQKELWNDKVWTDFEDRFSEEHTLDDLGCGTSKARIFSIAARHPLNMFLNRFFACNDWNKELQYNPKADEFCADSDACKVCQPGEESTMCGRAHTNALEDESCMYDNIILQALVGSTHKLTRADLELAKSRLRHFDLIFIIEYFSETLQLTTTRLGWSPDSIMESMNASGAGHKAEELVDQTRLTSGEITHEQWQRIIKRNSLDIELYDYMRELSFGMLQADGLPVPTLDSAVSPQWSDNVLKASRSSWHDARTV